MRFPIVTGYLVVLFSALVRAESPATQPALPDPPVKVERIVRSKPDLRAYVVRIDLTDPRLQIRIAPGGPDPDAEGPWETSLQPTSAIAQASQLDVAVNSVFFMRKPTTPNDRIYRAGEFAASAHLLVSDGVVLTSRRGGASAIFDARNEGSITKLDMIPPGARAVVSGDSQIVHHGKNVIHKNPDRAPRTALGLKDAGKTLVLYVADGRRAGWSDGLSLTELADEMIALGCHDAINLDGGGSSTLVVREGNAYKVRNVPSDGSIGPLPLSIERPVAYAFGVRWIEAAGK